MTASGRLQKQAFLRSRSPFLVAAAYAELNPTARPRETPHRHEYHQRTSSKSFLADELPSWLDDLLDEPETPAWAHGWPGHRGTFVTEKQRSRVTAVDPCLNHLLGLSDWFGRRRALWNTFGGSFGRGIN